MNEPWINNIGMVGDILSSIMGLLGVVDVTLALVFIPKGKANKLVLGVNTLAFALAFISLILGIIAYLSGQPYSIWDGFGLSGLLGTIFFGMFFFAICSEYRKAELRKAMSEDLTFGGNNDDQQN